jgi:RNA polymerase sigma-70 factor (ECF subfamily)
VREVPLSLSMEGLRLLPDKQILECTLLVHRCQRGDRSAFERIVAMWERPLFYYLRRLAPSEEDTWDLLQETWLKVFRAIGSIRDPRTLPAFLYRTARNNAISRLRIPGFHEITTTGNGADLASLQPSTDDDVSAFDDAEQVHHALDQIPLAQREALTLFFLRDLSLEEIAELLAVPVGTVKSRVYYGKQAIRKILSSEDGDHHDDQPDARLSRPAARGPADDAGPA